MDFLLCQLVKIEYGLITLNMDFLLCQLVKEHLMR